MDISLASRVRLGVSISLITLFSGLAVAQEFPAGWRRPFPVEIADKWRQKSPTRFSKVKGDFDGDGKPDIAELLVNPSRSQFALFVKLASADTWQLLDKPCDLKSLGRFGIDVVKAGKYETACGKGYGDWACAHGEPDWLRLSNPGIDFFYTESSDSIYYWDRQSNQFREVVMSD
jgi:hypothetical protein